MGSINWDEFKVRCSAIGRVMSDSKDSPKLTEKQAERIKELEDKPGITDKQKEELASLIVKRENSQNIVLSAGCIEYLMEVYAWKVHGMIPVSKESMDILTMRKGKLAETDSIKLLTLVKGVIYDKNTVQVFNDYLTGEPDVFSGDSIHDANVIEDTKTMWDYPGFLKSIHRPTETGYKLQVRGYGDITGANELYISKCLVNTPDDIQEEMKWKLIKKLNVVTEASPEFIKEWEVWQRSMIFDKIPYHQRVHSVKVEPFTDYERQAVYDRVKVCREWLNNFHEAYRKINL